jgi:bifunctional UDP-N-acetylglucosamine pyrophosphorylase/glucosamine-1-phosphate N-acetyltransferase
MLQKNLNSWGVVILAAGQGKRLGCTDIPKVMCPIGGEPIVSYTVASLRELGFFKENIRLVVGFAHQKVRDYFGETLEYVLQAEQLGTAHAANLGIAALPEQCKNVLVMGGDDSAFYTTETLATFMMEHEQAGATVSVLTATVADPSKLGRIIRDTTGKCTAILEKEQINESQKTINEINTGTYCFDRAWFEGIFPTMPKIEGLGEYGLNRTVEMAFAAGKNVQAVKMDHPEEWFGVNTPEELAEADRKKKQQ